MTYTIGRMIAITKCTKDQIDNLHKAENKKDFPFPAPMIMRFLGEDESCLPVVDESQKHKTEIQFGRILKKIQTMSEQDFDQLSPEAKIKYNEYLDFCHACDYAIYNDMEFNTEISNIFAAKEKRSLRNMI